MKQAIHAGLLGMTILPALAMAKPCDGIAQAAPQGDAARLPAIAAQQLKTPAATILKSYQAGDWHILYVAPVDLEHAYLFYQGDPANRPYMDLWAGSARPDESTDIRKWVMKTFPGIPARLANCFAWTVTAGSHD